MPLHWPDATVRGHVLTVYITPGASRSTVWINVLGHLLKEFNNVSKASKLPIRMKASNQAPKGDSAGADIAINIATDKISMTFPDHDPIAEKFSATAKHGRTLLFDRRNVLQKAFVFLPATPQVNSPAGVRGVGPKVLMVIALHELLHACGLENADHGDSGLFQATPPINPGNRAIDDAVGVQQNMYGSMPPYVIDDSTVQTLLDRWTL